MEGRLELRPTNTGMGYVAAKAQMQGCPPSQYQEAGSSSMLVQMFQHQTLHVFRRVGRKEPTSLLAVSAWCFDDIITLLNSWQETYTSMQVFMLIARRLA